MQKFLTKHNKICKICVLNLKVPLLSYGILSLIFYIYNIIIDYIRLQTYHKFLKISI